LVGIFFSIAVVAYAAVLVRSLGAAAAYKNATASIVLTEPDVTAEYIATIDSGTHELAFGPPHGHAGFPSIDYIVPLGQSAHLLRPEFHRPRQLVLLVRRADGMPKRSVTNVYLDGRRVGECGIGSDVDQTPCTIDLDQSQAPAADAWHIRLEDPLGGMIVTRVVIVIGR
jgi:hypothetical protein